MTAEEYRADAEQVKELQAVLEIPALQRALLVIHDGKAITDAGEHDSELASVRKLSNLSGRAEVIRELYGLAIPLREAEKPQAPNFGVTEPPPKEWVGV